MFGNLYNLLMKEHQTDQSLPLLHSQTGRQRITVGISWDTPEIMPERPEAFISETDEGTSDYTQDIDVEVGFVQETFDLDLVCLIFDEDKNLLDAVSPTPEENVDLSGAIYHSGDDVQGISSGDDEQISVELANLPENIHYLVFLTMIQSGHRFWHILNAEFRLADGKTNQDLYKNVFPQEGDEHADKTGCAFCILSRGGETGWAYQEIGHYKLDREVEDWSKEVLPYL